MLKVVKQILGEVFVMFIALVLQIVFAKEGYGIMP